MSRFQSILLRTWMPSVAHIAFHSEVCDLLCQTYGSRMLSRPLLSLSFPWRQYDLHLKSVYEVGRASEDASSLCVYKAGGLSFLSILPLDALLKGLETFMAVGIFFHEHRTPGRAPWQAVGIPWPASHLSPQSLLKMIWLQISFLMLELWRVGVWNLASPKALEWVLAS